MSNVKEIADGLNLGLSQEALDRLCAGRPQAEALARLAQLGAWMRTVNTQNHDGVTLTPVLLRYLAAAADLDAALAGLDQLRQETRQGRFDRDNELQRELEFKRYASEARRQRDWPQEEEAQRRAFAGLPTLPPPQREECRLSHQERLEAGRLAYEAKGLLDFVCAFRAGTERPITVFGNDRYGRLFVVEPLEPYLEDEFAVHYERVPSHGSMRLTVPDYVDRFHRNGFAPDFMRYLSAAMPHVVLVDVCSPRATESYTKIARGIRDLVNWFMVFNHIRAGGDRSRYAAASGLPEQQLAELEKWWEFEVVARRIHPWIDPGPTYGIAHWAPEPQQEVLMGELVVPLKLPVPGEAPQVIAANPCIYRSEGEDLPELLRRTQPYFFNDPEKRVKEEILPGFGEHGFETRVSGFTTDQYVAAIQRQVGSELERLVGQSRYSRDVNVQTT